MSNNIQRVRLSSEDLCGIFPFKKSTSSNSSNGRKEPQKLLDMINNLSLDNFDECAQVENRYRPLFYPEIDI